MLKNPYTPQYELEMVNLGHSFLKITLFIKYPMPLILNSFVTKSPIFIVKVMVVLLLTWFACLR